MGATVLLCVLQCFLHVAVSWYQPNCRRVPSTECVDVDIEEAPSVRYENVTKCFVKYGERCNTVYDTVLEEVPRTMCTDVSREECKDVTETKCESAPKVVQETVIKKECKNEVSKKCRTEQQTKVGVVTEKACRVEQE